jgi:hypothetical protein
VEEFFQVAQTANHGLKPRSHYRAQQCLSMTLRRFASSAGRVAPAESPMIERHRPACLAQISEIFDADTTHSPRGCVAQAGSVAKLLRAAVENVYLTIRQSRTRRFLIQIHSSSYCEVEYRPILETLEPDDLRIPSGQYVTKNNCTLRVRDGKEWEKIGKPLESLGGCNF